MKAKLFTFVRGLKNGTPPRFQSYLKSLTLLLAMVMSVNMWGESTPGTGYTKITSISSLAAGDEVILFCDDDGKGVTGYSGSDATVSSSSGDWVKFVVEKSGTYYYFKHPTTEKYIAKQTSNKFTIDASTASGNECTVDNNGVLCINSRYLCKNGNYYRMYTSIGSYKGIFVYKAPSATSVTTLYLWEAGVKSSNLRGDYKVGGKYTLPSTCSQTCGTKTFVGWSTEEIQTPGAKPEENFYEPGTEVTLAANNIFYAVFADAVGGGETWEEISSEPTDGTYAILTNSYFMKASISSSRFENGSATPAISNSKLTTAPAEDCIWEISKPDTYYRIKNGSKYAGGTSSKNQGALLNDPSANLAKWTINYSSDQFEIINYGRSIASKDNSNKYLRNNTTNGWATYASGTGSAPRLFKKSGGTTYSNYTTTCRSLESISVKTNPTQSFTKGDAFSAAGLVITENYDNGDKVDVAYNDHVNDFSFSGYDMNTIGNQTVTITYKSKTTTYGINVAAPSVCKAPTFSIVGGTYTGAKSVELNCLTDGATIHYTTDGTTPTTLSPSYSTPINVNQDMTIKAFAAKEGLTSSAVVEAAYVINYTVTFNMKGHGSAPSQITNAKYNQTITAPTEPSVIGYTFDGWFKETECTNVWNFASDKITESITLFAKWTEKKFDVILLNSGNQVGETLHIQEGATLGTNLPTLTEANACDPHSTTFVGWTSAQAWEGKKETFTDFVTASTVVSGNMTLNAVWAEGEISTFDPANTSNLTKGTGNQWTENTTGVQIAISDGQLYTGSPNTFTVNAGQKTLTITSLKKISAVEVTLSGTDYEIASVNNGTLTTNGTQQTISNVNNTSVICKSPNGTGNSNQIRATLIKVIALTNYITTCSSDPLIEVSPASLTGFSTIATTGNPSAAQSFTVEGYNLTENISVTAPTGYEVCLTEAGSYTSFVTLTQAEGKVAKTTVYVRLAAAEVAAASVAGNISLTSTGATEKTIALTGEVIAAVTVTFNNNGTITDAPAAIKLGKGGTLGSNLPGIGSMTAPITGYTFVGWVNHNDAWFGFESTLTQTLITGNETVNADVTYDAVWAKGSNDYKLIDENGLKTGNYVFGGYYGGDYKAMGNTLSSNKIAGTAIAVTDGVISNPSNALIWTIQENNEQYALYNAAVGKYLNTVSGSANVVLQDNPAWFTVSHATDDNNNIKWYFNANSRYLEYYQSNFDTESYKYGTINLFRQDISNYFVTTPDEYTVTWHKGNAETATTPAFEGQTFADIVADAPSVDDEAAGDCANTFMGWATEAIEGTDADGSSVQWAKDNTTPISGNVDYYAVFAQAEQGESGTVDEGYDFSSSIGTNWTKSNIELYFSKPCGMKKAHAYIMDKAIADFSNYASIATSITIGVTSFQNGGTGSVLTVYLVDEEGNTIGNGKTITPVNTNSVNNATRQTIEFGATSGATGYMVKCTTFDKNMLITATDYSIEYNSATYSNYITQCCTTPEHPLEIINTNLTVKMGETLPLSIEGTGNGNPNITWASLNGAVATVSGGVVTPVSTGKATITVSQAATGEFCEQYDEVEIEVIAANEFGISFTAADGGTTVAKVNDTPTNKATTGTTVAITATPTDDYNFTGWTVNAGGVTLADASLATTTFTMGEADVEITPSFTLKKFTVTLDAGTGDVETTSYTEDVHTVIELPAAAHCQTDVWVFQGWSETNLTAAASECPALVDNNYEITKDVILYAIYKKADGGEQTIGYRIYSYFGGSTKYYVSGVPNQQKMPSTTNVADASIFTIDNVDGTATNIIFQSNNQYLYINTNGDLTTATNQPTSGKVKKWSVTSSGISSASGETKARSLSGRYNSNPVTYEFKDCDVEAIGTTNGNYTYYAVAIEPVIEGAASYHTSPECVSLTWVNGMSADEQFVTYPSEGKIVLPTETPVSCAPGLYSFVGWTTTNWINYKLSDQGTVTAETAAPEHATTYYAEFVNTAGNRYRTSCPETLYAITYKANGGEGEDYIQYSENKTDVTSYDGAAFSKTDCSLYQWNTTADGTGTAYKPNSNISSLNSIIGEGTTGTLYAQWTGELNVSGNVHLTSGKGITVYTTAAAGNLITITCPAIDMVHHIRYKFLDSENNEVNTLKLCNNGTENFNQLTNIATNGVVGAYEQTFSIRYTPTEHNQKATYTLLLEGVNQGGTTVYNSCSLSVEVRSLPEQFVIAIKKTTGENKGWYAVPNVLETTASAAPNALLIDVDDANNPTYAISSDNATNALYKSADRQTAGEHRGAIRLQSVANDKYITASYSKDETSFYMPEGNSNAQQFYLNSTDCNVYKVTLDPAEFIDKDFESRWICMSGTKIGWYRYDNETKNVYFLPIKNITEQIEVENGQTVNLTDIEVNETTTIIVHAGGTLNADKVATIGTLQIERAGGKSGQVNETATLTANNAYFDVTLNATAMKWYDIAVPFKVDRLNGLSFPNGGSFPLNDVLVYNGATRATNGTNGSAWEYQDDGVLEPGKGYFIMFATNVETVRFTKKASEKLNNENEELAVSEFASQTSDLTDANWNYVANNSLHYVNLGFEKEENKVVVAQTYVPVSDSYTPYTQDAVSYIVGTPFFVQVLKADNVAWSTASVYDILRAPAMTTNRVERFTVELSSKGEMNDRLFVSADENARNEYQIGKDVAKMGVSSTIAQMWVENYNTKLCANEAVLYNDQATFSLGVFVPSNGEYTLTITNAPNNAELYLTEDGQPIWNLSKGAYTTEWAKGTHKEYGLMLQVTDAKAPTNINGINGSEKAVKFLKNSDIYILRNAKLYNAQGQLVK